MLDILGEGVQAGMYNNLVLRTLGAESVARLGLQPVTFQLEHELEFPGKSIRRLYFIETGMASMTTTFANGAQVEAGMFGYESIVGVSALMGTKKSLNRVYTQIAGHGYFCSMEVAATEFRRGDLFQSLALRCVQAQLVTAMQSAGCNAQHAVDQRLARWLLICADRANSNIFKMSQEFLGYMLGNSRPSISAAAAMLKDEGLIEYSRGAIHICNVQALQARACECYLVIKHHLDSYAEFDSGLTGLAAPPK